MHLPILRNAAKALKLLSLVSVTAIALNSCGGGGSSSGSNQTVIAPESLDNIQMRLFDAFDLKFFRIAGTRGNENGGVDYDLLRTPFRIATADGTTNVGRDISLPSVLTNVKYTYVRTGLDTGRIALTWINRQIYPLKLSTGEPVLGGDMFWGGPDDLASELIIDILFTDNGGFIGNTTARVRSAYIYTSTLVAPGPATFTVAPLDFDSVNPAFALNGVRIPTGYNPYNTITDKTPASSVWESIQSRTIDLSGSDANRRVAHQSTGGAGVPIPGVNTPDESGSILIDSPNEGIVGGSGSYSYARTGGSHAKFAIRYDKTVNGAVVPVELIYDFDFDSLDGGTFTGSNGSIGRFLQFKFTNQR